MSQTPLIFLLCLWLLAACAPVSPVPPAPTETPGVTPSPLPAPTVNSYGLSAAEMDTLRSLERLDDYPLYTMRYVGAYAGPVASSAGRTDWGCSLFAALGDETNRLYGRNFDWQFSPVLLLFTAPPDGYASVSMVDITYLGFDGDPSKHLMDLPLDQLRPLLDAPSLPFDGLNEKGLAIGMAAVDAQTPPPDPQKQTIDELMVIREVLDHAATVNEAIQIFGRYNIDMESVPIHYLVASATGDSALVEFYRGEMVVTRSDQPWQAATNFVVAATDGQPQGHCPRYDRLTERLQSSAGQLDTGAAFTLLSDVSQRGTQWSVVYDMTGGQVSIVMGGKYNGRVHTLELK
jgi:hypothetical protein